MVVQHFFVAALVGAPITTAMGVVIGRMTSVATDVAGVDVSTISDFGLVGLVLGGGYLLAKRVLDMFQSDMQAERDLRTADREAAKERDERFISTLHERDERFISTIRERDERFIETLASREERYEAYRERDRALIRELLKSRGLDSGGASNSLTREELAALQGMARQAMGEDE